MVSDEKIKGTPEKQFIYKMKITFKTPIYDANHFRMTNTDQRTGDQGTGDQGTDDHGLQQKNHRHPLEKQDGTKLKQ